MSETAIRVNLPGGGYDVVIGRGSLADVGKRIRAVSSASKVALITDDTVVGLFGVDAAASLARSDFEVTPMQAPAGEQSKNWFLAGEIVEAMAAARLGRGDLVVALGGGVVGDLAGFCAAIYLRGIDFVQVPTTLLAMVDSSVGGKTGVDLAAGKNLAGAFKQPLLVLADTATLDSLPDAEWRSGIAEAVKSALLDGEDFSAWFESHVEKIGSRDAETIGELVGRCVEFKAGVVGRDEKEEGPRECLNYGHTLGHAIEKVAGYGAIPHGIAVAEGMRFAARVAMDVAGASADFVRRQDRLLDAVGLGSLPLSLPAEALLQAMHSDKKSRGEVVRMVLVDRPGSWTCVPVDDAHVLAHLEQWAASKEGESR